MRSIPKIQLSILLLTIPLISFSQYEHYVKLNYAAPVDEPILLAGNFAELRSNHFHGGLDIKTAGEEGHNIYSIEDGYVSRIKVGEKGYGKCLYVYHPKTGHTSVYAHLQKFNPEIQAYVVKHQYEKQSYTIELFPKKNQLSLSKGQIAAISGNTGGSSGPHLHFEIRDAAENTMNPLLFGFNIRDEIKPNINILAIYPQETGKVNEQTKPLFITPFRGNDGTYKISDSKVINIEGPVGFGVSTIDYLNNSRNRCGIFSISLYVDDKIYFKHQLEKVSFAETRYINSLVDYATWRKTGSKIQKCFIDPGNRLSTYSNVLQDGIITFNDEAKHSIKIEILDSYQNKSELLFVINSKKLTEQKHIAEKTLKQDQYNSFQQGDVVLSIPNGALYKDTDFSLKIDSSSKAAYYASPVYHILDRYTALHKRMTISIKAPDIDHKRLRKSFIAEIDGGVYFNRTSLSNGYLTAKSKYFGKYAVVTDLKAPSIINKSFENGQSLTNAKQIVIKITDNLSGIANYKGYIDNRWVLFEYEYKKKRLTYTVDENFPKSKGKHVLKIQVTDKVGNMKEIEQSFYL